MIKADAPNREPSTRHLTRSMKSVLKTHKHTHPKQKQLYQNSYKRILPWSRAGGGMEKTAHEVRECRD